MLDSNHPREQDSNREAAETPDEHPQSGAPGDSEAGLAQDGAKLQAILNTTVDGIITINERGVIQSFNRAAERIFGYQAGEVIGRKVNMLMPSPHRNQHDAYLSNYLRSGEPKIIGIGREVMGLRKDGGLFPLYLAVSEVRSGERRYFTGILRDVTEQKKAEEKIRSVARFPDENPNPVLRISREGRLLYANASSSDLLADWNCSAGEVLQQPWRERILQALQAEGPKEIEARCGDITYSLVLTPIPQSGEINVYGRDITESKRAEEALRQSEQRYRTLVESSSDAILMIDTQRRIISFNAAFLELFDLQWHEVAGKSTRILHSSEESFRRFFAKAFPIIERTGSFRSEWELMSKNGTPIQVEETMAAIRDPDDSLRGYVAVIRDITERKRAEQQLADYREHLEQKVAERTRELESAYKSLLQEEKLKTLGTISAELAHEIRNPIMSIGGFAKRLQKKFQDIPEVAIIVQESQRLEKILNRIQNYLKPVEMRPKECAVDEIITETLELLAPELAREGITTDLDLTAAQALAYVDPAILIQVLIIVVRNAAEVIRDTKRIAIQAFESDQNIHIQVRIPVSGMKIKDPEHFLMPFGEEAHSLSVPLCIRLLQSMGGYLSLSQEEDEVVFAISLLKGFQPSRALDV